MNPSQAREELWSIILAGGEGERIRPFITQQLGYALPKQYCTFVGTRSMLQHTWSRADRLVDPRRKVTVVARHHGPLVWKHLDHRVSGQVLFQPQNCDTAAGIFLPLTYVRAQNLTATVVIFPSDHFVFPENIFIDTVHRAIKATVFLPDRIIALGVRPTNLEVEYGWIQPGLPIGWSGGSCVRRVEAFLEKPDPIKALASMSAGGLWNTLVMAFNVETLWQLGWNCFPDLMKRFAELENTIGTSSESQILHEMYRDMPCRNFSSDLLQRHPESVGVMELEDVIWSDWGRPERIGETLRSLGKESVFPINSRQTVTSPHASPMMEV